PLADVYDTVAELRSDFLDFGLPRKPEVFPPKREVADDGMPYPLRVPGRHPKRPYYSRVYNFDGIGDVEWLEGADAIEAMMNTRPAPLPKTEEPEKAAKSQLKVNK